MRFNVSWCFHRLNCDSVEELGVSSVHVDVASAWFPTEILLDGIQGRCNAKFLCHWLGGAPFVRLLRFATRQLSS